MPAGKKPPPSANAATTGDKIKGYKPPWIKESAEPNKETETPWGTMRKRDCIDDPEGAKMQKRLSRTADDSDDDSGSFQLPQLRKVSLTKQEKLVENGDVKQETFFQKPQLKSVKTKEPRETKAPPPKEDTKLVIPKLNSVKVEKMKELPPPPKKETPDYRQVLKKVPTTDRVDEEKKRGAPAAPPMPPPPPPMLKAFKGDDLNEKQKAKLESLKSRPKVRPDWTAVLKGIEGGAKLKHVESNDRSKPLLPKVKAKGQFLYESEKDNAHNVLLKEIQQGVKLKTVKINDRSKPNLEGLRKIRRQMTIEEQIQKSVSMASMASLPPEQRPAAMASLNQEELIAPEDADEMDDIDRVRDDLQSTKQLLAMEMRNKEQQMRENKRLLSKIQNLEKELEIERGIAKSENDPEKKREPDEKLIVTLKAEAAEARRKNEDYEKRYTQVAREFDKVKFELDEEKRRNSDLEKKLQEMMCSKRLSVSDRRDSQAVRDDDGPDGDYDRSDSESDEEETEEKRQKRIAREIKLLANKLHSFKNKVDNAKKERIALKEIMKKHQNDIREEKRKFRQLQKEVNKMASLMKDSDSDDEADDDDDEEKADADDESTEDETSDSETESSDTESESERSQSEPEDAPPEKKKENLVARSRRHENRLAALKKTNFMLKTNAERLQDDLNIQKELTQTLQTDLDSVLAELG